jgi:hypothetical protein
VALDNVPLHDTVAVPESSVQPEALIAAAGAKVPRRVSFEKAKGAKTVSGWEELAKALE